MEEIKEVLGVDKQGFQIKVSEDVSLMGYALAPEIYNPLANFRT
jgi:hypothetical protein